MKKMILGRTNIEISRVGFGVLPIQRVSMDVAKRILRKAYENGINFYDTARAYSDSEEKIGNALADVRGDIVIATKTHAKNKEEFWQHLETSLTNLKTDYIDIYQFHNPKELIDKNNELYIAALEAKQKGYIRHIGITNHSKEIARKAIESDLFDSLQYPLNHISSSEDLDLALLCKEKNIGFIAMKALSGGIITDAKVAFSFLWQYDNVIPIWGIQRERELDEFIALEKNPPLIDSQIAKMIEKDKTELASSFCRGCGYCLPCPVGIEIPMAARMKYLLRRAPYQRFITSDMKAKMNKIYDCKECNLCVSRCPYNLQIPKLLKEMIADYEIFIKDNT